MTSFEQGHKLIGRKESSPGLYLVIRGKLEVQYKDADCVIDVVDESEYLGDFCLIGVKSHFDYVCKYPVVCLFISLTKAIEILLESKEDFAAASASAKLRLKYLVYLKRQTVKARKEYESRVTTQKNMKFNNDDSCISDEANHLPSPKQKLPNLETEGENLITDTETLNSGPGLLGRSNLLTTPSKKPQVNLDKTPSTTSVFLEKDVQLKKDLSLLKSTIIGNINSLLKKNGGAIKKVNFMHIIAMADVTEDLQSSEDSEPEPVDLNKEKKPKIDEGGEESSDECDRTCSEADESIEMDDPIASIKFKELKPKLELALRLLEV